MAKQIYAILLAAVCAVLAFMLYDARQENAGLKKEISEYTARESVREKTLGEDTNAANKVQHAPAVAAAEAEPAANPETVESSLKSHQRVMTSISKMQDNPTMNKVLEASQRGTIGALYADMIEYLNLTPEESRHFMDLLMYRQMENVDFGMKLMSGQLTNDQKDEVAQHLRDVHDDMYTQMKAFLNSDEDFEEFEFYEKTMNERMALSQMDQSLSGTDDALSDETYRELLDMMHRESTNFDWSTDLHDQESMDLSAERFSPENMKKHSDDVYELVEQILTEAARMLNPAQLEAFKTSFVQTTDMQIAQFQMAGQLLGGGEQSEGLENQGP